MSDRNDIPEKSDGDSINLDCSECGHCVEVSKSHVMAAASQCGRVWNPRCPECGHPYIANMEGASVDV